MGKRKKRKPKAPKIDWYSILITGAIDFLVGLLLLVIDKITS
jgi:hypothetical protein